jgi:hypothetical protein
MWARGIHWRVDWVGPKGGLDSVVKRKIPSLPRESNPRTPIVQPAAQRYTDWAIKALKVFIVSEVILNQGRPKGLIPEIQDMHNLCGYF